MSYMIIFACLFLPACGACSSTQDLAAYIEDPDLRDEGTKCAVRGISNGIEDSIACYQEVGFSHVSMNDLDLPLPILQVFSR